MECCHLKMMESQGYNLCILMTIPHLGSLQGTLEISVGSVRTERDGAASDLRAEGYPAVSVMTEGSPGLPSSATRWLTSSAVLEVEERPGGPQEVEEAGGGQPWGCQLTGWQRKVSCPEFHSWREQG